MARHPEPPAAVVVTPLAHLHAKPDHRAELKSQRLGGELVRLIERHGSWWLVAAWDGYRGWVRDWSLAILSPAEARDWAHAAQACAWGHAVKLRVAPDSGAPARLLLPWGARVAPLARLDHGGESWVRVRHPEGWIGYMRAPEIGPRWERESGRLRSGLRAAALARAQCGVSYLWGGASSWGFDCSGLVQWAFALAGRALPRDAADQIRVARPLGLRETAEAGDLLFFGREGAVNHVAIFTAPPRFVHAYGRVEEAQLSGPGTDARPELRAICLGAFRLGDDTPRSSGPAPRSRPDSRSSRARR